MLYLPHNGRGRTLEDPQEESSVAGSVHTGSMTVSFDSSPESRDLREIPENPGEYVMLKMALMERERGIVEEFGIDNVEALVELRRAVFEGCVDKSFFDEKEMWLGLQSQDEEAHCTIHLEGGLLNDLISKYNIQNPRVIKEIKQAIEYGCIETDYYSEYDRRLGLKSRNREYFCEIILD